MENNIVFNITVCAIGILILFVHLINLVAKKNKRKDEKWLLAFISFTIFHFAIYLMFSLIKINYKSDNFIVSFYTLFYMMNNIEAFLLFMYMLSYVVLPNSIKHNLLLIGLIFFGIFIALDLTNVFTKLFFYAENGVYIRSDLMIVSQIYQLIIFSIVFFVTLLNHHMTVREKIAFASYCILPLVAIILQNIFKGYAIAYASIIVAVEILFFFVNVQKNIDLAKEEEKNKEAQIKIMLSQIKPHFIYNSLSAISTLITINPDKAQKSLDDFTEYLRINLSSLTEKNLIPFTDELRHIETYISLEKMRFNDRLNVIYDIGTTDFMVPPLSIQPLVENAIKHGILKKIEGGVMTLTTYETATNYIIEIKDDGIGFDINTINFDENKHFGLKNISYRINQMGGGNLNISSKIGVGTKITVTLKK